MNIRTLSLLLWFSPIWANAEILVTDLYMRAPIPGQDMSAAYFTLQNQTESQIELVAVNSPAAGHISIHESRMMGDKMHMVELDGLTVKPQDSVEFKRGGLHLMVYSPDDEAVELGSIEMIFSFADGSILEETARIEHLMPSSSKVANPHSHGHQH